MTAIGRTRWAIPEGYIPSQSTGPEMLSHETACILNAGEKPAGIAITICFRDREPARPYTVTVPARRTLHLRFSDLEKPEKAPLDTDDASNFESDVPIIVQYTRLDSRQSANALMTTMAFAME